MQAIINRRTCKLVRSMNEDNRRYPRKEIKVSVELTFLEERYQVVNTRDISEGGMFIEMDSNGKYPIGEMVQLHYLDPLNNDEDTFKDAIIVRVADSGIAVSYIEMDAF
jgi:c-di-GMP-binding flagellar brake protein YcgR